MSVGGIKSSSDIALVVSHIPILEVVVFILLAYSSWAAGDCNRNGDDDGKQKMDSTAKNNLMWVRIFAGLYCIGFFLKWLMFFYVFPGRIMPLKGKKSIANEAAVIVFVIGDWFRYSMLPAGTLCVIIHLLNAYKQLHGSQLNVHLKNSIIGLFVGAMIFRFVFQYQTATNAKVIDVCFRPMTCNPMWFISTCLSGWILWKAKKAAKCLEQGTLSADHQARQTLLFRKLWAMFIGCTVAVIGRTIQLMGCESPHSIESNFSYRMVKRFATYSVLITQLIVSWHSLNKAHGHKATVTEPSAGGSRLIRVTSNSAHRPSKNPSIQLGSYISKDQTPELSGSRTPSAREITKQSTSDSRE